LLTVRAAWTQRFHAALLTAVVTAAILYFAAFRLSLPSMEPIWVSRQIDEIAETLRPCSATPFTLTRYREPSAIFLLGTDTRLEDEATALGDLRSGKADFAVFNADAFNRLARQGGEMPQVLACINGFNPARGHKLRLHVLTMKAPEALAACRISDQFACASSSRAAAR
jgi:hypothetical protein